MIIVTGGAGFIGSALLWALNKSGYNNILVVDNIESSDKWKNLVKRSFHSLVPIESIWDWLADTNRLKEVKCVFHMGACSSTTERNMDYLLQNNTHYTIRLFELCKKNKIPFIYASSAATYGNGSQGFSDSHDQISELRPINPYGYSKQLADQTIIKTSEPSSFWCGLKFFNVYGPGEYHKQEMRSLIAKAYPQVKETGVMRLFKSYKHGIEDGKQKRDFIYIKDVVDMMIHIWENHKSIPNGIYNIGTGKARSFFSLGQALFKALAIPEKFEFIPMPEEIRDQYQYFTEAKIEKLRQDLKYHQTMTSLEEGVSDYVRNYLNGDDRYL
jgi:ADP-L-glycero-D-manno-heptose 6-epimerase